MAPSIEDDFVLTIEDDDFDVGASEEEIEVPAEPHNNKKRKLEEPAVDAKSKKKAKKAQKNGAKEDIPVEDERPEEELGWADVGEDDGALDSDFEFQVGESTGVIEDFDGWERAKNAANGSNTADKKGVDIDDIIARRQAKQVAANGKSAEKEKATKAKAADEFEGFDDEEDDDDELLAEDGFGMGAEEESDEEDVLMGSEDDEDNEEHHNLAGDDGGDSDNDSVAAPVAHPDDFASASEEEDEGEGEGEGEDAVEAARRKEFFASEPTADDLKPSVSKGGGSFQNMGLSRPILKGLATVGFSDPTPIQTKTIPIALLGKDVVGGAVTGSGKTAAFIIPILERLLYRPKKVPTTRVAILMPTRELAVQCFNVARKLASFTDITFAQIVGGFSLREQETVLKQRPDVIIATPGRFIDHMRNSASFTVETLEILILDEADRMLEDGFADEINEILDTIPKSRQTMLFSATITDSVDKLIRAGLNKPVRLVVDAKKSTVTGLIQEFVRLRPGREGKRLACLLYLCKEVYTDRTIVFFRQKKDAHRIRVVFGLCGLKAAELHGSMSQEQRIEAVESFRDGRVAYLLATDLASRGLDIKNVSTVLNYEAPQTHEIYLHRVGRTARAGRTGRSCTIAAEPDRRVVKAAVKSARSQKAKIVSRVLPVPEIDEWDTKLQDMEDEIREVLDEEREAKLMGTMERDMRKGENLIVHEGEIMSRPKRTWFETEKEKKEAKELGKTELNGANGGKGLGKISNKVKKKLDLKDERTEGRIWKKGKGDAEAVVGRGKPGKVRGARGGKPSAGTGYRGSGKPSGDGRSGGKPSGERPSSGRGGRGGRDGGERGRGRSDGGSSRGGSSRGGSSRGGSSRGGGSRSGRGGRGGRGRGK